MKIVRNILLGIVCSMGFVACEDDLNTENYYTFTGEMMSDYITTRPQFSSFSTIVQRAELMDLLSTYGHYTCFAPDNKAVDAYLKQRGKSSLDELTDADIFASIRLCVEPIKEYLIVPLIACIVALLAVLYTSRQNSWSS